MPTLDIVAERDERLFALLGGEGLSVSGCRPYGSA
jgi:hypothetical protein